MNELKVFYFSINEDVTNEKVKEFGAAIIVASNKEDAELCLCERMADESLMQRPIDWDCTEIPMKEYQFYRL